MNHKNINKKYLTIEERLMLIDDIQSGKYLVKHKKGRIQKKINKKLYSNHCKILDILEKLADIRVLGKGTYGKAFKICMPKEDCSNLRVIPEDSLAYSIKQVIFQDFGTYNTLINNPDRYENVEIRMLQLLSKFLYSSATPHINSPIMSFICQPSPHLPDRQQTDLHPKRYIISELANYGNLYTFVTQRLKKWKNDVLGWKVLFFQILSVFAVIHRYYPNFLHNDLHLRNILVRSTGGELNGHFEYNVNDVTYYVPDIGFQISLWDFDFASIAGVIDNDKLITMIDEDDANIVVHRNQYYDIHMCFGLMNRYWGDKMPNEISDWLNEYLLTDQIPSAERDERLLESTEYTTPAKLLKTSFFNEFHTSPLRSELKGVFTGVLDPDIEFDFGDEKNRYTDPKNCQYQHYIFLDPKNRTPQQNDEFHNRYLCELASKHDNLISNISSKQSEKMQKWVLTRLNEYSISSKINENEKKMILYTTMKLFSKFLELYNVTSNLLYAVLCSSLMYASFQHLLSYVTPFNDFLFWYQQPKLDSLNPGDLEDTYKQFTGFIAKYVETV